MSLTSARYTAANGLVAHSDAMTVVSDNIANVNTAGYKQATASFSDLIASSPSNTSVSGQVGQGSFVSFVHESFTQGALLSTGNATDLALLGDGFFVVRGSFEGFEGSYYTRNGEFHVDKTGTIVNNQDMAVQGYLVSNEGTLLDKVGDLQINLSQLVPPNPTTKITVAANLDETAPVPPAPFSLAQPGETSTFSTSTTVYDSLGAAHDIDIYFVKDVGNLYDWYAVVDGSQVNGGTPGTNVQLGNGTLQFTTNGALDTVTGNAFTVDFRNATPGQGIALNFGDAISTGGTGLKGITSYASTSTIAGMSQDGYTDGEVVGLAIEANGVITGSFTNGIRRTVGQLAVASFPNDQGLQRLGSSLYTTTLTSGEPALGPAGTAGRGNINAGSLEQSNVNLAQELIRLMSYQRGFEANTRTVQASDQMEQLLVQLGR